MKKRDSNLELMRVALMCVIPAYHLLVYNLILKAPYNDATLVTLAFCVAGAIPANYAFMAMSSYFLLETEKRLSPRKFLTTGCMALTLAAVRFCVVRGLYGFNSREYMVEGYITKGAWWYMDAYLLLLLAYPFLNHLLERIGERAHRVLLAALTILLIVSFAAGKMTRTGDLGAFCLIYVLMGYLRRKGYRRFLFVKIRKWPMLAGSLVCYLILFLVGFWAKWPAFGVEQGTGNDILQYIISRYNPLAMVMGVFVFLFFRSLRMDFHPWINRAASAVTYVFLLHETLLAVLWYLGYYWFPMEGLPGVKLLGSIVLFTGMSFGVALIVEVLYRHTVKNFWDRLIDRLCKGSVIKNIEEMEAKL